MQYSRKVSQQRRQTIVDQDAIKAALGNIELTCITGSVLSFNTIWYIGKDLIFLIFYFGVTAEVESTEDRSDVPNSDGEDSSESDDDLDETKTDELQADVR